jgi:hypothetical protein
MITVLQMQLVRVVPISPFSLGILVESKLNYLMSTRQ